VAASQAVAEPDGAKMTTKGKKNPIFPKNFKISPLKISGFLFFPHFIAYFFYIFFPAFFAFYNFILYEDL
jgi:hypothetical protein